MTAAAPKKGPAVEPGGFPLNEFIVFSLIGGIVVIGIISAVIAGATPKGILTNLGFYVSVAIIFSVLALGFNLQWGYTGLFNAGIDRKSTRLNSSHRTISYAVFCLKKKT